MKVKPNIEFYDTLQGMFRGSVANYKDNILASYSDGTDSFTYAAMEASCRKMDMLLNSYGIGRGGRVAVLAVNRTPTSTRPSPSSVTLPSTSGYASTDRRPISNV